MRAAAVQRGDGPIILGMPHVGTHVPAGVAVRLNDEGQLLRDTDWHIEKLYAGLLPDVTTVAATFHRYVIDANRDPSGQSLYPGASTTELVPTTNFDGLPIWQAGAEPTDKDIAKRTLEFHAPYHAALAAEIARIKAIHGYAVLYDCHSIRSVIPWLFEGALPDFNIGTDGGKTCDARIEESVVADCQASGRRTVLNGRFRGGWTTRHYGQPHNHVHAIQMELAQSTHLTTEQPPFQLSTEKSAKLRPVLARVLTNIASVASKLSA